MTAAQERREYHREYMRRWRAANREENSENSRRWRDANPEKAAAQRMLQHAVERHGLVSEPCLFCDEPKVVGHHHDYSLPLDITWLCRRHHTLAHKEDR